MAINYTGWEIQITSPFDSGTASSVWANTLVCAGKSWVSWWLVWAYVWITGWTGVWQSDLITGNSSNSITVKNNWITAPTGATFQISYKLKDIVAAQPTYATWDTVEANRRMNTSVPIRVLSWGFLWITRENLNFTTADNFLQVDYGWYFQSGTRLSNTFQLNWVEWGSITGKNVSTSYLFPYMRTNTRLYATYYTYNRALSDSANAFILINQWLVSPTFEAYDCMFTNCSVYVHTGNKIANNKTFWHQNTTSVDSSFSFVWQPTTFKWNLWFLSPRVDSWSLAAVWIDIVDHFCNSPAWYDMFLFQFTVAKWWVIYLWNHTPSVAWTSSITWYSWQWDWRVYRWYLVWLKVINSSLANVQWATVGVIDKNGNPWILTGKQPKVDQSPTNAFPINSYTVTTDANGTYTWIVGSWEWMPILYALYTNGWTFTSIETKYADYTFRVRKYWYKYLSQAKSRTERSKETVTLETNPYTVANETTAGWYTGIAIDGVAKTITLSSTHTIQELYDYTQWRAMQTGNITYDEPLTTANGTEYQITTGWTLQTNYLLSYNGKRISGGTIILHQAGTKNISVGTTTLKFTATGLFDLSGWSFTGTVTLVNTSGWAVEVVLPEWVTYVNSWPNITARIPYTYLSVLVNWPVAGSRIQIYDTANNTQLYEWTPTFPFTWTESNPYSIDRSVRLRVMYKNWATAKLFREQNIWTLTFASPSLSVLVTQEDDTVYNTNWIDGSTVTGVSIVDSLLRVNVSTGTISWQQLYAYETDWLFTSDWIIDEGRYTVAKDIANYAWYNFKIKNTTSPTIPLVVTGWYWVDWDTGQSVDMIDDTGWTIIFAPDHVVPKIITVAWASVITWDVSDILTPLWVINTWVQNASVGVPHEENI